MLYNIEVYINQKKNDRIDLQKIRVFFQFHFSYDICIFLSGHKYIRKIN